MTGTIEITPDGVRAWAHSVSSASGLVADAGRALRSSPTLASSSEVAGALSEFCTEWSRALALIADDVSTCGRAISSAVDGWEALDLRLAIAGGGRRTLPTAS